jgi:DNA polymerase-2
VEPYLLDVVARLRAGELDDRLVYRKALRKRPEAYTTTTPPHVAVARTLGRRERGGRIAYVITTAGPQPAESRQAPLDYEHYLDKQVGAVAEPVLTLRGLDLEQILGTAKQLRLF